MSDSHNKSCTLCSTLRPVLVRCQIDESGKWHMVCPGACWRSVSGGQEDAKGFESEFPHYRYGGMWKVWQASKGTLVRVLMGEIRTNMLMDPSPRRNRRESSNDNERRGQRGRERARSKRETEVLRIPRRYPAKCSLITANDDLAHASWSLLVLGDSQPAELEAVRDSYKPAIGRDHLQPWFSRSIAEKVYNRSSRSCPRAQCHPRNYNSRLRTNHTDEAVAWMDMWMSRVVGIGALHGLGKPRPHF
jgi:hypothetical protein